MKRGLVQEGEDPASTSPLDPLSRDGVDVLHTIGGDDANGPARDSRPTAQRWYELTVVGLPKTHRQLT